MSHEQLAYVFGLAIQASHHSANHNAQRDETACFAMERYESANLSTECYFLI